MNATLKADLCAAYLAGGVEAAAELARTHDLAVAAAPVTPAEGGNRVPRKCGRRPEFIVAYPDLPLGEPAADPRAGGGGAPPAGRADAAPARAVSYTSGMTAALAELMGAIEQP